MRQCGQPRNVNGEAGASAQAPTTEPETAVASRPPRRPYRFRLQIHADAVKKHAKAIGDATGKLATIGRVTTRNGRVGYQVSTCSPIAYREAETYAKLHKIFLFGHPPPPPQSERTHRVYIKQVPRGITADEVREELEGAGLHPLGVHQHVRRELSETAGTSESSDAAGGDATETRIVRTGTFRVTLRAGESRKAFGIKAIASCDVKVVREQWKRPRFCERCCRWGHTRKNCEYPVRCKICTGEGHPADKPGTKDCPIRGTLARPKCCNCGGQHTASYTKCERCTPLQRPSSIEKESVERPTSLDAPSGEAPRQRVRGEATWSEVAGPAPPQAPAAPQNNAAQETRSRALATQLGVLSEDQIRGMIHLLTLLLPNNGAE